ncbi:MAG TPA: carbohydrate ABC transporter permease [Thermotogota bacterium]|nr:carbohydrate ABC transporter permease [Thermotogota bacterium]NLH19317.1 carbohydrate ABC transporter permease [Thermotogaceae bacterium]OQC32681.1 MAG: L-arabinose transport system permease protein AraQ [Thermotogota bacterium ADurb.Bin062]HNW46556.1 carbohydrate ABC transporter permease [Thermotogota bacterium]HNY81350.1 carbohydrate ABC transporter permease [Thermotogota bacterium]
MNRRNLDRSLSVITQIVIYALLFLLAASTLLPYILMIALSLMAEFEMYQIPPKFIPTILRWSNYIEMWQAQPWGRYIFNTLFATVAVLAGQLLLVAMGGYALARMKFPGRDFMFKLFIAFMMLPGVVTLIPGFIILHSLGWVDTFMALIVPSLGNIWGLFLMRQYMLSLPSSLEDAGRIDGANRWQVFWKLILPLCKPVLATVGTFTFLSMWRSFFWPLIVTRSKEMRVIEVGVAMFSSQYITNIPAQLAAATLSSIPMILVYLFAQKWIVQGIKMTAGYDR